MREPRRSVLVLVLSRQDDQDVGSVVLLVRFNLRGPLFICHQRMREPRRSVLVLVLLRQDDQDVGSVVLLVRFNLGRPLIIYNVLSHLLTIYIY